MPKFTDRLQHAWNAFRSGESTAYRTPNFNETVSYSRPDRMRFTRGNEKSIVTSVYNRLAMDAASINIRHIKCDENGRYKEDAESGLSTCFNLSANLDQTGRAMLQDLYMSMLDEGCVALVPIDTDDKPNDGRAFEIESVRVAKIVEWRPSTIKVEAYNEQTGKNEQLIFNKRDVCIIENPLYQTMNEKNSTMQRLVRKLALLDIVDETTGSGKLDLIIQLPYTIKTEGRRKQAEDRRKDIEMQLTGSKYGIAYTDGTEHITQLNRSLDNHLLDQVKYLTELLYSQLGLTKEIMEGTADESSMLNYYNRSVEPMVSAVVDEARRKWLTNTARSRGHDIRAYRDPFKLVPVSQIAEIADKFTRNEIMSTNEIRQIIGMKPVDDPKADELRNKNLNAQEDQEFANTNEEYNEYQ